MTTTGGTDYCSALYPLTIVEDDPIAITATPVDATCFGTSDGSISITVDAGGSGPFMYSIDNGATYVTGNSFPNLAAGTYPVRVRDANMCENAPQNIDVDQPDQLTADTDRTQDYTCNQLGEVTVGGVTLSGGSGDYQFSIDGGAWTASTTTSHTFTGLDDGTYSFRVRDANASSCAVDLADVTIAPLPVEPTLATSVAYNCDGTGNITVTPFDPSYTYSLDGAAPVSGAGANIFADVAVGSHTITVNYGSDCTVDTNEIVADGNAFEASVTASGNPDCNGDASGTITIDADNYGPGGYQYSINGGAFSTALFAAEQITGLDAQAHGIVVRDVDDPVAGCTVTLSRTLTEPAPVAVSAAVAPQITCDDGATITASASGGTGPYTYQLEDDLGTVIGTFDFATNGNNNIFGNITVAGDYVVRMRDDNNCETVSAAVTATAPEAIVFDLTETACYSGANDGQITVDVTDGNGGYTFSIDGGPFLAPTPTTATTYTFDNLADGTYNIQVRDQFGCPTVPNTQTVTIHPQLTLTASAPNITACDIDGTDIAISASGGDNNYVFAVVPSGTSVTDGDFATTNPVNVTAAGDYNIYVRDNNGGHRLLLGPLSAYHS